MYDLDTGISYFPVEIHYLPSVSVLHFAFGKGEKGRCARQRKGDEIYIGSLLI